VVFGQLGARRAQRGVFASSRIVIYAWFIHADHTSSAHRASAAVADDEDDPPVVDRAAVREWKARRDATHLRR
jgi:hypothetical protein